MSYRKNKRRCLLLAAALVLALLPPEQKQSGAAAAAAAGVAAEERPPVVALTFDDGPRRDTTAALLDGLARRGAHATFFTVGQQIGGNEDLICRMEAEGHQVGLHTFGHVALTGLSDAEFEAQVGRERRLLEEILGHGDFALRPPYGFTDADVRDRAEGPVILWSVDPEDWKDRDVERIVRHVTERAADGDIILMHDIYPSSVEAALEVVDRLQERGFLFATVCELFDAENMVLDNKTQYYSAKDEQTVN